ncbi:hypothetical protein AAHC03_020631 [Spirometra sp. Aus1]
MSCLSYRCGLGRSKASAKQQARSPTDETEEAQKIVSEPSTVVSWPQINHKKQFPGLEPGPEHTLDATPQQLRLEPASFPPRSILLGGMELA